MVRTFLVALLFSVLCAIAGCSSSTSTSAASAAAPPTPSTSCPAGQRAVAATGACVAVGTTRVPTGFVAAASGWGFDAVLPDAPCTGATIASLGSKTCAPIDDCSVAFPPTHAKVAVRASGVAYPDQPSLPVVATIDEALAMATSGDTIAIDEGQYASPASITASTNFVGRCAQKTIIQGGDFIFKLSKATFGFQSLSLTGGVNLGLLINTQSKVTLDRVYLSTLNSSIEVGNGSTLTVKHSVLEGPPSSPNASFATSGVQAIYGSQASIDGSELRGYQLPIAAQSVKTTVTLTSSVVHQQLDVPGQPGSGAQISAFLGAAVSVTSSLVEASPGRIAIVGAELLDGAPDATSPGNPPASMTFADSLLLHDTLPREGASAIDALSGATLSFDNVSLVHQCFVGIGASDSSTVTLANSSILGGPSDTNARTALSALGASSFTVTSSALVGATQFAVLLDGASKASLDASLVMGTHEIGIKDATVFMGSAQALAADRDCETTVHDSAFVENEGTAIFLVEASLDIDTAVLAGTHASSFGRAGVGITSIDSVVAVRTSTIARNQVALAVRGGRALLSGSTVTDHTDAIQLDQVTFTQTNDPRDAADDRQVLAAQTMFARNGQNVVAAPLTGE